jgi:6-phosphogluconolactonase (cycloisomerase 2 family)
MALAVAAVAARQAIPQAAGANVARDLRGAIDIHVHAHPDNVPRALDGLEAARFAKDKGMRAIVLKSHFDPTAGLAWLARRAVPGIEIFGGIDLNLPVGGMNPHAVEHMARMNGGWGRMVWMSTFDAENQVRSGKSNAPFVRVSQNGALLPETKAVIAAIRKHNLVLASGHVSAQEALLMFEEGRRLGIGGMVATHGMSAPTSLTVEQAQQATRLGAFIEFVSGTLANASAQARIDRIAEDIRSVGVEHAILSSDLGQAGNALPADGFATFIDALRRKGFTDQELDRMAKQNPARLLGLDDSQVFLYAAAGPELSTYDVDAADGTLTRRSSVMLPFAVQYVWHHPSTRFLYAAWSNGMQGDRHGVTAYRVDPATGALQPHGPPIEIPHRPVHLTVDANAAHVLVAYNNPSSLSVHALNADGTIGAEVKQPAPIDGGIYAHQIRVHPSNRMVVMVTRGNGPAPNRPEDPGALKIYGYKDGLLTNRQSIAPNGGIGYQPRHVDFHPTLPYMYLNVERQNQLQVYRTVNGESVEPKALFTKDTLDHQAASAPQQMTGAIHVHPNGRFVYLSNRASGTTAVDGKPVWEGGENTIGVYAIDQKTGEPVRIQNVDSGGMHARTFTLDPVSKLLVAANMNAVTKPDGTRVPASLAVFRLADDGTLSLLRKYDMELGVMWAGFLRVR